MEKEMTYNNLSMYEKVIHCEKEIKWKNKELGELQQLAGGYVAKIEQLQQKNSALIALCNELIDEYNKRMIYFNGSEFYKKQVREYKKRLKELS